ncbi:zinc-binding dehydrogenase [Dermatophilus congolensis]|uniref:zinc-binding dehydrogenase n=3 Tax=Dermatophilus congolensis TaxID=1863 RepID=UPI001AAF5B55|nr:zinc-binding dehydrogenase [Dermatophilus congolensis]MBO3143659.1 alcohol dehydrogenase catalytic domain-containing protein [Dermatophilus congolensis]MBO3152651.1 alcohol dehydrogenase catalytic domain-containing protein [Dermatophilus congolensis]MBO3160338.1 alcohol dehydrogenase catalytic domain-containing protein [Dermatophilus congolensis]MBO3177481.1 alcohol dehydrogenase catalytic domain-containing protein [Dermatophilus congolensis]MBO3184252.1 alcohol dehydrogenase catalytic doma
MTFTTAATPHHDTTSKHGRTMLAERFNANTGSITIEELPIPTPGPGQVRLKVAYCGICHSDLSLINGNFPVRTPIVTQGHEVSGYIDALGPGVTGWSIGDPVIPSAGRACLTCRKCRRGDFLNCLAIQLMAFDFDGGWAEYVIVNAIGLTRVPEGVPMDQAAILADAVSTPFAAVMRSGQVHLGNAVGIWGLGGVGTHLLQLAKLAGGTPLIAVDLDDAALARARRLGADYTFRADDPHLIDKIEEATYGRMIDVAFDAVGITATCTQASQALDTGGKLVVVGLSGQDLNLGDITNFALGRKQVIGHLGYKVQDIAMLAEMLRHKRLDLSESISAVVPLTEVKRGIDMLESREGNPIRILVQP